MLWKVFNGWGNFQSGFSKREHLKDLCDFCHCLNLENILMVFVGEVSFNP